MALLFFHNPDQYATSHLARFWTTAHADAQVASGGYGGVNALTGSTASAYVQQVFQTQDSERFRVGARVRYSAYPSSAKILLAVVEEDLVIQTCLSLNTDGTLSIWRGSMDTLLLTTGAVLTLDAWHRIGFKGTVGRALGAAEVHLNSTLTAPNIVGAVTDVNTAFSDHLSWTGIYLGLHPSGLLCHPYAVDGSSIVNDLLPGLVVISVLPTADGTFNEWEQDPASDTFEAIDDATPDDDTTRLLADTFFARFSVSMQALAAAARVHGAQSTAVARNFAGTGFTPTHEPLLLIEGTEYYGPWRSVPNASWFGTRQLWGTNPRTDVPWTIAELNAAEWGGRLRG